MVTADFAVCFNIMRERGLVHCRNPTCGAVLGSYEEGAVIIVHLFNVREMLFEPQLHYAREVGETAFESYVVVMKFGDGDNPLDISDGARARSYILDPAFLPNSSNSVTMSVASQSSGSYSDKRVGAPIRGPVSKIARPVSRLPSVGTNTTSVIVGSKPSNAVAGRSPMTVTASQSNVIAGPSVSTPVTVPSPSIATISAQSSTAVVRPSAPPVISGSDLLLSQSMGPLVPIREISPTTVYRDVASGSAEAVNKLNDLTNIDLVSEFENFCAHTASCRGATGDLETVMDPEELTDVIEEDYFALFGL